MKATAVTVFALLALLCGALAFQCWYLSYQWRRDVGGYLKLAADAPSVAMARERLGKAIAEIEARKMTAGTTSIIFEAPQNDIGEWYRGLKAAQANLESFPREATEADVSTALQKLRETLLDHTEKGDAVTAPASIYFHPHVLFWCVVSWIGGGGGLLFGALAVAILGADD